MTHLKLLSVIILTLLTDGGLSASNFDDIADRVTKPNLQLNFAAPLARAEELFVKHCKEQKIEVNWLVARKSFYLNAERGYEVFKTLIRSWLYINYSKIDELKGDKLHQQYLDLYLALNPPKPESSIDQPEEKTQSRSSPPSSTVVSDQSSDDENGYQDDDTDDSQSSGTATPPAPSTLRRRHSPPHTSTVATPQ